MKRRLLFTACAMLAMGAFGIGGSEAQAQCAYGGGGYGGYGGGFGGSYIGSGYGGYGYSPYRTSGLTIGFGSYNRGIGYSSYRGSRYRRSRGRGHYDWHPTSLVPHGNHFHIQPGHWDYHRGRHHGHH